MNGTIVCGIDGSEESRAALRVAAGMAEELELRLVLAHVSQPQIPAAPLSASAPVLAVPTDADLRAGEALLEQVAAEEGLPDATRRTLYGIASERLADLADEEEAAFVVVGSRGRGAFKAAFLGSVSAELIGVARCPVLVVPPGARR